MMTPEKDIATVQGTMEILHKFSLRPRRSLGQNFLVDPFTREKIIAAASLTREDTVLEIGPGIGALTQALARTAGQVIAVEIDRRLADVLRALFDGVDNVEILQADILKMDLGAFSRARGLTHFKVTANLPYYITTPVLMRLLESTLPLTGLTLMVQREVAERLTASPDGNYGAISVMAQYYADIRIAAMVPPHCFYPKPNVDSAVLTLVKTEKNRALVSNENILRQCVKAAFGKRRKTLVNCLAEQPWLGCSKGEITQILVQCGFDARIRGEALPLCAFITLANALNESAK
ncbi:MAG: 16S rRNA (adenine(1518)-N(6)/adenine(1519)-N(6))-dimethyltransferase RsmA [Clostridiales bacterium]|jgi:16S rRNA (adenine1518-N6/adenine1519-N6)-dimethyltransferase|nr:16S rRNA (adenine(1518)-N(6)/adenine(1519)-N(6))-dimethyltransferase RsmA [Clostridiales bacterium]